jgi:hypothetical protein
MENFENQPTHLLRKNISDNLNVLSREQLLSLAKLISSNTPRRLILLPSFLVQEDFKKIMIFSYDFESGKYQKFQEVGNTKDVYHCPVECDQEEGFLHVLGNSIYFYDFEKKISSLAQSTLYPLRFIVKLRKNKYLILTESGEILFFTFSKKKKLTLITLLNEKGRAVLCHSKNQISNRYAELKGGHLLLQNSCHTELYSRTERKNVYQLRKDFLSCYSFPILSHSSLPDSFQVESVKDKDMRIITILENEIKVQSLNLFPRHVSGTSSFVTPNVIREFTKDEGDHDQVNLHELDANGKLNYLQTLPEEYYRACYLEDGYLFTLYPTYIQIMRRDTRVKGSEFLEVMTAGINEWFASYEVVLLPPSRKEREKVKVFLVGMIPIPEVLSKEMVEFL